ncbi:MAG: NAD(P)H-dependent glycerol-3-phosphate dehydrogenase [Clostridia bacterium]|nr:NAD(P)H-dependent glycerol-3-phosphate dehydrogenase [Clostridia bacterium]
MNVSVFGCGRWGSFIAWYLNKIGKNVTLWGRPESSRLKKLIENRKNDWLEIDQTFNITDNLKYAAEKSEIILISISAQSLSDFMKNLKNTGVTLNNKIFVLCMKGIEESTGKRLSEIIKDHIGNDSNVAVWVGPGHVQDFITGTPNCMIIDSEKEKIKKMLVKEFSSPLIRFYYGSDLIGSEIGAASKNVMGIAAGILDGLKFESLKGALMSRGTREISRLIKAMGGNELSAYGLAHLGDYQATLFSKHSNNRKFGEMLALGQPYDKLAEGVYTSFALLKLGKKYGTDLPICTAVNTAIKKKTATKKMITDLFLRSIKNEF